MINVRIKKLAVLVAGVLTTLCVTFTVKAAQPDMTVYITDSGGCYHLDGCSQIKKTKIPMMLSDTVGKFDPCTVCGAPSNADVDKGNVVEASAAETTADATATSGEIDLNDSSTEIAAANDTDVATQSNDIDLNDSSTEIATTNSSTSNSTTSNSTTSNSSNTNNTNKKNSKKTKTSSDSEIATDEEVAKIRGTSGNSSNSEIVDISDSDINNSSSKNSSSKSNSSSNTSNKNSNSNTRTTTSSGSTKTTTSSGSKPLGVELLTQSQRRSRYGSKTNPKRGTKPATTARPASNGYLYADFGTFNGYNSENNLGGTPIYLLGTVMDIVPFLENNNPATGAKQYRVAILVNDCDGYQWYIRAYVAKDKLEQLKATMLGQAGYIYGGYAGYSGVMSRPMMDATIFVNANGTSTDMSIFI